MRKKMLKWLAVFLAAMVLFTFLSRAADSVNVAVVQVKTAQNQIVTHRVTGVGKIEGIRERAVFAREDQSVSRILVQEGQSVQKGDVLLVLSETTIEEAIEEKTREVDTLSRSVQDLESRGFVDGVQKSSEMSRARQDYNVAVNNGDINISYAQAELAEARRRLQEYYASRQLQAEDELFSDGAEFEDAADDAETEQALADNIRMKKEALNQVIQSRNQAVIAAEREMQDASMPEATDGSLADSQSSLDKARKELEELNRLKEEAGRLLSPVDGVVKSITARTGSRTSVEAAVVLYETEGNLRMTGNIREDDLPYVAAGGAVSLKGASGAEVTDAVVESIREDETDPDSRILSVSVPENVFVIGETVEFTISRDEGPYSCCVPLSAVYEDKGQNYVYVMDAEDSVLGEVQVARRMDVSVQDKNETVAALSDGALSSQQKVIVQADRAIGEGSRVRLQAS